MTDIIEVAKKSKLSTIVDAIYGLLDDEAFADHYRKEGAAANLHDVRRYQFLRRLANDPDLMDLLNAADTVPETPEEFDAAIDAAMASELRAKGE
jgi:hypothetical protein